MSQELNLITLPLEDIHPYINNPRKNDGAVKDVEECIRQCGYNSPIVVDENHVILAGHTRLKALQKLGRTEAQVVVREGLTDEQKRLYRIADNKTGEEAEWDFGKLTLEAEGLDFSDFHFDLNIDLSGIGVTDEQEETQSYNEDEPDEIWSGEKYGVPYKGSKSRIAERLIAQLPEADTFVDLFAGGMAMTHCAMLSGKYKNFIANDIDGTAMHLFIDAVHGKYHDEKRWVSREDFFTQKDSDPYVRWVWSFGNDGRTYLYGRDIEPYKRGVHEMIVADTIQERRSKWAELWRERLPHGCQLAEDLQRLERLQQLERLQNLQQLERLQNLQRDYQDVAIPENSVIYCDIPYRNTNDYGRESSDNTFDYERFYEWACAQTQPVFISEYWMPEDRFKCVYKTNKLSQICATETKHVEERLYVPKK